MNLLITAAIYIAMLAFVLSVIMSFGSNLKYIIATTMNSTPKKKP